MRRRCKDNDDIQGSTAQTPTVRRKLTLAEILEIFAAGQLPLKFTAYDGSVAGPEDAEIGLNLLTPRGTTYLATAPGELGLARAYVSGDLEPHGVHPGDPYELLKALADKMDFKRPPARVLANIVRSIGIEHLKPIAPPPQEALPRWRRFAEGLRHSKTRDAEAIHHHYDVSNTFYEWVLGPSMTYTCACYPRPGRDAGRGAGEQVPAGVREAAAEAGRPAARRRLRLGRHGPLRRPARREGDRRHAVEGAGRVGAEGDRRTGPGRPRRGAPLRLPRRPRVGLRRGVVDRADRTHRRAELSGVLPVPQVEDAHRRAAAQPLHHPPRQPDRSDAQAVSSTATSSPTGSSPARAASSPRHRTSAWRWCTRRTCAITTR